MQKAMFFTTLVTLLTAGAASLAAKIMEPPDPARVEQIAAMLAEKPAGLGAPSDDRPAWQAAATNPAFSGSIARAESLLKKPLPEFPEAFFLEFSRNGNRSHFERAEMPRRERLGPLVFAECIENKGRFIPAIEQLVQSLCAERTWELSAHDPTLSNFNGKSIDIDLGSSALARELATADWLIGNRLSPQTRDLLRKELRRRVFDPFLDMVNGKRPADFWLPGDNNWNAVCLSSVTDAALAEVEDRHERAFFVVAAEKYSQNYLNGFAPDGFCVEGVGYWNYGFGNYLMLAETIRRATDGKLDLLQSPTARLDGMFGARITIINGVCAAFADSPVGDKPSPWIVGYMRARFRTPSPIEDHDVPLGLGGGLFETLFGQWLAQPLPPLALPPAAPADETLRAWFKDADVLIARPAPHSDCDMGIALKGGGNDGSHHHDDLGSFVVVIGGAAPLLDPGPEHYTRRTFSSHRFESKMLNSFGHSVPIVGGKIQSDGGKSRAVVVDSSFTDDADTVTLDLTSAYPCPTLKKLTRTFVYSRRGAGSFSVTDTAQFTAPTAFADALITLGKWKQLPDGGLRIEDAGSAVRVDIDTNGQPMTVSAERIEEDAPVHPTHIAIDLRDPVMEATITMKITPSK